MSWNAEAKGLHQEGVVVEHCCFEGWITNNKESQQRQASKRSRAVVASGGITDVDALGRVADLLSKIRQLIILARRLDRYIKIGDNTGTKLTSGQRQKLLAGRLSQRQ